MRARASWAERAHRLANQAPHASSPHDLISEHHCARSPARAHHDLGQIGPRHKRTPKPRGAFTPHRKPGATALTSEIQFFSHQSISVQNEHERRLAARAAGGARRKKKKTPPKRLPGARARARGLSRPFTHSPSLTPHTVALETKGHPLRFGAAPRTLLLRPAAGARPKIRAASRTRRAPRPRGRVGVWQGKGRAVVGGRVHAWGELAAPAGGRRAGARWRRPPTKCPATRRTTPTARATARAPAAAPRDRGGERIGRAGGHPGGARGGGGGGGGVASRRARMQKKQLFCVAPVLCLWAPGAAVGLPPRRWRPAAAAARPRGELCAEDMRPWRRPGACGGGRAAAGGRARPRREIA